MIQKKGYLLIDGSSVGFAATASPQKLSVGEFETQGIYWFLQKIRAQVDRFPMLRPVILWDGGSWRHLIYAGYKGNRAGAAPLGAKPEDMRPATKHELQMMEIKASFVAQRQHMQRAARALGMTQMWASNFEADDLAGLMVKSKLADPETKIVLLSADMDWAQLVQERVSWIDPIGTRKHKTITISNFELATGCKTGRQFLEKKALCGDLSDNVPGVGGIGDKGALNLLTVFGSVAEFFNQWIDKTIKDAEKLPKKFRDFAESDEKQFIFRRNMVLMDLLTPRMPAPADLQVTRQALDVDAFAAICREFLFQSIDPEVFAKPFKLAA